MKINEILDKRSTILTDENEIMFQDIHRNCSEALVALSKDKIIYKGLRNIRDDILLTDPKLKKRKSKNTENYYTLLFDNLPSWKEYPKRSRLLICSTSRSVASEYGNSYLVLPFNGAKIGVCPTMDMWLSFLDYLKGKDLADFNYDLKKILLHEPKNETNYRELLNSIFIYKNTIVKNMLYLPDNIRHMLELATNIKDTQKALDELFNPNIAGFKVSNIHQIPPRSESYEVWTDSKSYLINVNSMLYRNILINS